MLITETPPQVSSAAQLRMSDLISALSYALDLTEGQPMGHAVKCYLLSMRLADILNLSVQQKSDLYYATLLKDAGCSSNAARMYEILGGDERKAKQEVKSTDWTKGELRRAGIFIAQCDARAVAAGAGVRHCQRGHEQ